MTEPAVWPEVRPATVAGLLRFRAAERPERVAFTFLADGEVEAERLTYAELDRKARAIAARLRRSMPAGERALLLYPPGLEFIAAFFGCLYAGVVAVPVYPPRARDRAQARLRAIARDAGPKAALTTRAILQVLEGLEGRSGGLAEMAWIATDTLPVEGIQELPEPSPDAVAFLQYTSGSTATPKGVMVTHANLLHNERMIGEAFRQDEDSVVVGWLPLYHDMGLIGNVLQPVHAGATCVLMAPVAFLQRPLRWLEAISRYRATTSGGPNFAYELCARKIGPEERARLDLSSWRVAFNGAEPVREATLARFAEAFGPCGFRREAFLPCYGLAEATLFVTGGAAGKVPRVLAVDSAALERHEVVAAVSDPAARRLVSCGRPPGGQFHQRVVVAEPETGFECPPGRVGEIWIAGPSVARGYWRNAEATARDFGAVLTGLPGLPEKVDGPFLRTGDLGFVADGELYVTGRLKDLVIIRGRNHYPQDLELTAESSHPDLRTGSGAAFAVEVEGEERLVLVQEVERRLRGDTSEAAEAIEAIRRAVAEEHEVQVWEVVLVRPGGVPKTSSGKVRRSACRAAYLEGELPVVGRSAVPSPPGPLSHPLPAAGRGGIEGWLREIAGRLLGVLPETLALDRPLTGLGLDSLSAVELKGQAEAALGVELPLADLLQGASLRELAEMLEAGSRLEELPPLRVLPREGDQPLSFGQRSLWFLDRLAPEAGAYNIAVAARVVSGDLDAEALQRALERLVARHEGLRTVFPAPDGEPVQRVLPKVPLPLSVGEGLAPSREGASPSPTFTLDSVWSAEAWQPFDLERGPLLRVVLDSPVVLFVVHHIVADFWSLAVAARELSALYKEETGGPAADLPPLTLSYLDFTRWQAETLAGPRGTALWDWWRERLAGLPDLELPTDRPRPPVQTWRGLARSVEIPASEAEAVRSLAARHGATLFAALLAAFQAQLGRYTGQDDFAVGSPTVGRGAPELAGLIGYFVNPVPLRADLAGTPSFSALLDRTRRTALEGLAHADLPFALLAERLRPARDPARPPVFQALLVLEQRRAGDPPGMPAFALGEDGARIPFADLELESVRLVERRAQLELSLSAAELVSGGLGISLEANADLFDAATAERMLGHLRTLLAAAAAAPGVTLDALPLLTEPERVQLARDSSTAPSVAVPDLCLHELVVERARRAPDAEAVVAGDESVTYRELVERARALAERLRRLGVEPEMPVALCAERSAEMIVGVLGILEAGGVYLPLDPDHSAARLGFVLEDAGAAALVTDAATVGRLPVTGVRNVMLGENPPPDLPRSLPPPSQGGRHHRPGNPLPENLAYLIYTSGSTGKPKGVGVSHRAAVAHCLTWAHAYGMTPEDRVLQFASSSFDASVEQLFSALLSGATLVLRGPELWGTRELPRRIAELGLTIADFPTAFWNRWVQDLDDVEGVPGRLRLVGIGGEELLAESARLWARSPLAPVRLLNSYGPTEAVISATLYEVRPGDGETGPVPIGRPLPGRVARVLDRAGQAQPLGIPGELCVGGLLARGYLGRPDLTAAAFVPDVFAAERAMPGARLYRTGDLVRRLEDGEIEFLGRIDDQVKVRGFRIEPGEIEAVLAEHPEIREAAVLAVGVPGGERRLVGFVVGPHGGEGLAAFLRQRLPDYMVPAAWAVLPALPLNASGKVDRAELRRLAAEVGTEAGGEEVSASPRNPEEELLEGIFAELLGRDRVGIHDDFFALGGHSLLATRAVSRIARVFGADLPVSAVFQEPTVARLAARIAGGRAETAPPIQPVPRAAGEPLPLSFAQRRLWFLDQLDPGSAVYNVPGLVRLSGPLDVTALAAAVTEIARRHEVLRTVFPFREGEPAQIVQPVTPGLPVIDLGALPGASLHKEAERRVRQEAARPFDLARGPVCRVALVRLGADEHLLLVSLHHIVSDGWSLGIFLDELAALYEGAALPALPVQYADYAVWQVERSRGDVLESQLAWWRGRLADLPVLELPADHPRPSTRDSRGGSRSLELPAELEEAVARLARSRGVTLFMALLGIFQTLLARYTGEGVIPVGTPVAHRGRPETEPLIGLFVNTLVLAVGVDDDPTVAELLARVREASLGAYAHQEIPFERLVEELAPGRDLSQNPLFQVMFVLEEPLLARCAGGLLLEPVRSDSGTAKLDLLLSVTPLDTGGGGGLRVATEHAVALFDAPAMDRLLRHWAALLAGAAAEPEACLSELPLLGAAERAQLLTEWNDTRRAWPEGLRLQDLVRAQAERTPGAVAVVGEEERITYRELMERSGRIARFLYGLGIGPERRVGICLRRTPDMMAAILGVLEAGGAYVPLDPAYPPDRIELMYRDSGAEVLLTETAAAGRVAFAAGTVLLDAVDLPAAGEVGAWPEAGDRNMAYVIYTSGSTGRPKGVPIEHRSAVALVLWAAQLFSREDLEGVLAATSICFDLSVFEMFVPLAVGGKVIQANNALALPELAAIHEVTLVNAVPSPMAELVRGRLPESLRTVNLAGEALTADLVARLHAHPQVRRVYNLYGPTEDTTYSTGSLVPRDTSSPSIGRPLANGRAYVLGRHGEPVPIGVVGELYLGGDGLARGYLGRPEVTAERFVPDPFALGPGGGERLYRTGDRVRLRPDGEIEYLGRADFQVKISGIRIELGEIEATLAEHPAVRAAVVAVRTDGPGGGPRLIAYVVGEATQDELAAWLRDRLPAAMVPATWVELPALPLTPNGKVDRKRLPAPDWSERAGDALAPRTPAEEKVAAAFRDALGLEDVGAFDSFFELGGHSLLAVRAAFRLSEAFGVEVPVSALFQAPTVAALAEHLEGLAAAVISGLPLVEGGSPLSFAQQRLWFVDRLQPGSPAYNLSLGMRFRGDLRTGLLERALAVILERHEPLRTVVGEAGGEPVQVILPVSTVLLWALPLPWVDLTGLPPAIRERALLTALGAEARRPFDLARGPVVRFVLVRLDGCEHVLMSTFHHICTDGWSLEVFFHELAGVYAALAAGRPSPLPPLPLRYIEFARRQRQSIGAALLEERLAYWRRQLDRVPVLDLTAGRPRPPVRSPCGDGLRFELPPELTDGLRRLAQEEGATLFMGLVAAFAAVLARTTGQDDFAVGVPTAGRSTAATEGMIGLFINTLPLRLDMAGSPAFRELVRRARRTVLAGQAHELPFEKLVEELQPERAPGAAPLFQVMLAFLGATTRERPEIPGLSLELLPVETEVTVKFDLSLSVHERDGKVFGWLEAATDLLDLPAARRLTSHWLALLASAAEQPARRLGDLLILDAAERHQLLVEWNDAPGYHEGFVPALRRFEEWSAKRPEARALIAGSESLSYGELDRRAGRLAGRLCRLGIGRESRVGLLLERSAAMVEAILAVWKAGAAYVPLSPGLPPERLAWMAEDSGIAALVTQGQAPDWGVPAVLLEEAIEEGGLTPGAVEAGDLAYLIYTSGTTGRPKAVMVEHGSLAGTLLGCAERFGFGAADRMPHLASFSFDISLFELFAPLMAGGTVELLAREEVLDLPRLTASLRQATRWHAVPSLMRRVVDSLETEGEIRGLRTVFVGGDRVPADLLEDMRRVFPGAELVVLYGPTEATIVCSAYRVPAEGGAERSLIGGPLPGVSLLLLDRWGSPAPVGVAGELLVGGPGVSRGYHGRPELTAERYVAPIESGAEGRLYRTGDLARRLADGTLEFLGRVDHQVKIRGFRVEPGEVETALRSQPGVAGTVVVAAPDPRGESRLVAYVVPADGEVPPERLFGDLRQALSARLPDYMIPTAWMALSSLPLSPNGKVDRRLLPEPDARQEEGAAVPPRTQIEELLCTLWEEVLGVESVGIRDDFFALGGHSLLATQLMSRIRSALGVEIPLARLFEEPTVAALARSAETALRAEETAEAVPEPALEPRPHAGPQPLSFAQERLWFLDRFEPGPAYNIPAAARLTGPLAPAALAAALDEVVRRHEALRTRFGQEGNRPVQVVEPWRPLGAVPLIDLSSLPANARDAEAARRAAAEAARPFDLADLAGGGLMRSTLLRLGAEEHVLLLTLHHIVADGWSMGVLLSEVSALYGATVASAPSPLPELPVQYVDFALWQRRYMSGYRLETQLEHWRSRLAGATEVLDLPIDHPRPPGSGSRGGRLPLRLPAGLLAALTALGRREGWTPFMGLLAAYQALLARYSSQLDVVVGSPIANRNRLETERLIGFFVNTLALRLDLAGDPPFSELAGRARAVTLDAYAHQDLPFEKLVEELAPQRLPGRTPLFQAMLVLQNAPLRLAMPGLAVEPLEVSNGTAKLDLVLVLMEEGGELAGGAEYSRDLFEPATIARFLDHFAALLASAVGDPGRRLGDLELLGEGERQQLMAEWSGAAWPAVSFLPTVLSLFEQRALEAPEATALVVKGERLSYGELDQRAERLARRLRRLAIGRGDRGDGGDRGRVGLLLERSAEMAEAILAVWKAGAAYVPLAPELPPERLAWMAGDAGIAVVVAREQAPDWGVPALLLTAEAAAAESGMAAADAGLPEARAEAGDLAYLIYTSGTTGRPKGVMVEHRSLSHTLLGSARRFGFDAADRMPHLASFSFDISLFELFGPLIAGGAVELLTRDEVLDLPRLAASLRRATRWHAVPNLMRRVVDALADSGGVEGLRTVFVGGDRVPPDLLRDMRRVFPGAELVVLYGPTEATIVCSAYSVPTAVPAPGELERSLIGGPLSGVHLLLLDRWGSPTPVGVAGEIHVGGLGVSRGYHGRPELTAARYIAAVDGSNGRLYRTGDLARHLPDGKLEFVGRVDQQVKIRGFRVEPGEIEAALRSRPGLAEAVVAAAPDRRGESRLVAYLVPAAAEALEERWARERLVGDLREALSGRLPDYMIPVSWVVLPSLPLSPNGKVDRDRLPEPDEVEGTATHVSPRSPAEELLAGIWCDVLGLERVGVQTSFFDLGGHSLLATQVMSRLREAFGVDLPLRRLFEAPTVAELARTVESQLAGGGAAAETIPRVSRDQPLPLSFSQERLWVLDRLQSGDTAYNLPLTLRVDGLLDVPVLAAAFGEIVRRHETLRTCFAEHDGEPVQVILPAIPPDGVLHLPVVDLRGLAVPLREGETRRLVAAEAARRFDLARGPLLRTLLLRAEAGEHLLLVHMHHIVSDAWSMGVLVHEVEVLYTACRAGLASPLAELPVQYADFAVWQRGLLTGEALERQLGYWRERLAGAPGLDLPTDQPRPAVRSGHGAEHRFVMDAATSAALLALARRQGVTPFMVLAAALFTLLSRYSGQPDLSIGSPIANRNRIETEELIGFFVNTLVLRADLGRSTDFLDLLRQVREITLGAYAHQDLPFEELVAAIHPDRDLSHTPLFQVMLALQNAPIRAVRLEGIEISPLEVLTGTAKFDLSVVLVQEGEGLAGTLEYATDLFDGSTAVRLARHLVRLLGAAVADPGAEPAAMELLAAAERHQILREWNDTGRTVAGDLLLHQLFERQADRSPEAPAALWEGESLTYGELEARSNRLANLLLRLGAGPEAPVAIWMERSLDMLAALLGTLKSGAAYLPLDAGWPAERVEAVLAGAGARAVLVRHGHLAPVQELQWRLPLLADAVCLDIGTPEPPPEPLDPAVVRELWDVISDRAVDWVTAGGFVSSYTGQPFAEQEVLEYRDRVIRLAEPYLKPDARVLEIGCGSGLILWELAPRVGRAGNYVGLDPSPRTQERNRERAVVEGVDNVELPTGFAHEIDRFAPGSFDLVILASTAQFFPGPVYLERVLELALSRLAPGGAVVVADLLDPRRREELRLSLAAYAAVHPGSAAAKAVARAGSPSDGRELYVDQDFFSDLEAALPELGRAAVHHRWEWLDNELRFRYDVVLEKAAAGDEVVHERRKRLWTGWHAERCPADRPDATAAPAGLAYVIHTSGSTGAPKGIMVQHRPAVELVGWVNRTFGVGPDDRLLFITSPAFDLSVYDVFGVLAAGGLVHVASEEALRDPERLARMLREEPVTLWDSAPAALQQLVPLFPEAGSPASADLRLRLVLLSGDWIPVPLPDLVRASFPRSRVVSLGGATEATVWSNWYPVGQVDPRWPSIPYGRPIAGARYHVLDGGLEPCPIGVPGDLYIGGRGLSIGYARLPAMTAERFVPDPWSGQSGECGEAAAPGARLYATGDRARYGRDGNLEFLGRVDQQVKVRGYRIELEEIEAVLTRHPGVREAVVVAREGLPGDRRLVGYVVASRRPAPTPAELRSALQQTLPDYMVPWAFVEMEALPLTANGKVDRKELPAPQVTAGEGYVAPRNNLERAIATVWREVLGLARVGVHDNFFELGGSSLLVVKLHGRLKQALGNRDLSVMDLFRYSTVDALARYLAAGEARGESSAEQARARTRTRRESLQQLSQTRSQRRGRTEREE